MALHNIPATSERDNPKLLSGSGPGLKKMVEDTKRGIRRRHFLRYGGVLGGIGLAGCTGGGGSGSSDSQSNASGNNTSTSEPVDNSTTGSDNRTTENNSSDNINSNASNSTSSSESGMQGDLGSFEGQTLTVNGYGGEWQEIFREYVASPFEEETGATIELDTSGSASESYAQIEASGGDPGYSLAVLTGAELISGREDGTLAEIPESYENIYSINEKYGDISLPTGVVHGVQYLSLFTHSNKNAGPSDSWETLWNEGNSGHVILIQPSNLAGVFMTIQAARMEGGGINQMDPGFSKMSELCPDQVLTTIESSSEVFNYTNTGEVWATPFWSGRGLISIKQRNQPYNMSVPKEGAPYLINCLAVPSKAGNKELAYSLMNYWVSPKINAQWAMNYNVGPSHPGAVENLTEEYKTLVPNPQMPNFDQLYYPDPDAISSNREQWTERWVRNVGSRC